jgi:hypothetical protein
LTCSAANIALDHALRVNVTHMTAHQTPNTAPTGHATIHGNPNGPDHPSTHPNTVNNHHNPNPTSSPFAFNATHSPAAGTPTTTDNTHNTGFTQPAITLSLPTQLALKNTKWRPKGPPECPPYKIPRLAQPLFARLMLHERCAPRSSEP